MEHFLIDICNEVFQTHNTAISCLKRFAVFAIHGTEPKERKLGLRFYKTGLSCTAKYLNEMQFLTFIYYIKDLIRIKKFYTFYDRCKISSRIKGSSVRFQKHARRNLFCVTFFFYINNQCTLIFISKSLIFHLLHHIRNVRLCIRFFLPEVKWHIQIVVVSLKVCHGNLHNVVPQCHISSFALLKLMRCLKSFITILFVYFWFTACTWIDFFQLTDREWSFFRVFSLKAVIKVYKLRFTVF